MVAEVPAEHFSLVLFLISQCGANSIHKTSPARTSCFVDQRLEPTGLSHGVKRLLLLQKRGLCPEKIRLRCATQMRLALVDVTATLTLHPGQVAVAFRYVGVLRAKDVGPCSQGVGNALCGSIPLVLPGS